jgi:hypothetical protein
MNHFDVINSVRSSKEYLMEDSSAEKDYNSFMVNRGLSYFRDTVMYAQRMNMNSHLDTKIQYDYLFHSIRKTGKSFTKWSKRQDIDENIKLIMKCYGYNHKKAAEVLVIINTQQLEYIKQLIDE